MALEQSRKVDQEFPERSETMAGDCVRACVATLLGRKASKVPHFVQLCGQEWRLELGTWLRVLGYAAIEVPWTAEHYVFDGGFGTLCMALGNGPRGVRHAVVWDTERGLSHDPHPSRAGLVGDPISLIWLMRRDPKAGGAQ